MTKQDLADLVIILGAILAIVVTLAITCGCAAERGSDTPQKWDKIEGVNFGPDRSWEILGWALLPLLPLPRGKASPHVD